jgi:phage gpG-like protein
MALRGDFRALASLRERVALLTRSGFRRELAEVLGATAMKQVADEFRESRDPYGRPWKGLALRQGQPLRDTGRMANSVNFQASDAGFRLSIPVAYAPTHQDGATILPRHGRALRFRTRDGRFFTLAKVTIPRRQMVPARDTGGLGSIWAEAFDREAGNLLRRTLGRAA